MIRTAAVVVSGQAGAAALTLARNLMLAAMLPVEDYGIAAACLLVMAAVEMASALGLSQQIVQAPDGDDARLQAVLQAAQLGRGLLAAAVLAVLAAPAAVALAVPQAAAGMQLLALMPVLAALVHFDIHRMQRAQRHRPAALTAAIPAALSLAAAGPMALHWGDWRAMPGALIVQGVAAIAVSHALAERRWRLAFDGAILRRSLRFGLPILGDAVLLFLVFHGEKLIVARELGPAVLATLALATTLTLTPALVAARAAQGLFLPRLSAAQDDPARLVRLSCAVCEANLAAALALALGAVALGPPVVAWVFGAKYAGLGALVGILGMQQAIRLLREGPATVALARGRTESALIANLPRVVLLIPAWGLAAQTQALAPILALAIAAETCGTTLAFALAARRTALPLRPLALPLGVGGMALALALAGVWAPWTLWPAAVCAAVALWSCRALRGLQ